MVFSPILRVIYECTKPFDAYFGVNNYKKVPNSYFKLLLTLLSTSFKGCSPNQRSTYSKYWKQRQYNASFTVQEIAQTLLG
jgi:hypothetical protein